MTSNYKKRLLRVWQITVIIFSLCGLALMLQYGSQISIQNSQIINQQTDMLSRVIIRQAALTAAPAIAESDQQVLEGLILQLSQEPLLLDATLYDLEGVTIARTKNAMPLSQTLGLNTPLSVASLGRQQVIEPILHEEKLIGFIRLTLEQATINAVANNQVDSFINTIRGLVIGAVLIGLLLAMTFGRRRRDKMQYMLTHTPQPPGQ